MSSFRDFSQQKPPVDQALVRLVEEAKLVMEDTWEEEFLASVGPRVLDGGPLSFKQRNLLERIASGAVAEERSRQREREENGDNEPMPSEAAAGMDNVSERYAQERDANLKELRKGSYDHDRGY